MCTRNGSAAHINLWLPEGARQEHVHFLKAAAPELFKLRLCAKIARDHRDNHGAAGPFQRNGDQELGDLIYAALFYARMRVPSLCRDWVSSMIGPRRARTCPSLGGFKGINDR